MKGLTNPARNLAVFFLTFMVVSFVALLVLLGVADLVTGETMMEVSATIDGSVSQEDLLGIQTTKISHDPQKNRTTLLLTCKTRDYSAIEGQLRNILRNYNWWLDMDYFDYIGDVASRNWLNALLLTPAVGFLGTLLVVNLGKSHILTQKQLQSIVEPPRKPRDLYEELLRVYTQSLSGKITLEKKIETFMKQGLGRDEAIRKLAEEEKL